MKRIPYSILIVPYLVLVVVNLIIGVSVSERYEMLQTQNVKIQELQTTVLELKLKSILLPKTLTPEQKAEIITELLSRVGEGSTDALTPVQIGEMVTEIIHRIGGF